VLAVAFADTNDLVLFNAMASSIVIDFFIKSTGMGHVNRTLTEQLPMSAPPALAPAIRARALRLNCLTTHYADLWSEVFTPAMKRDGFAKQDPRLGSWKCLTKTWSRDSALRTPFERRQALVELDALVALALGLTIEQLLLIYRVQFPVLQQYERDTWYDARGKIIFTANKGLSGVGLTRKQFDDLRDAPPNTKLPPWAKDGGGPFIPPFDRCDRETDMAQAFEHFARIVAENHV
jgi:hypothetical protein